MPRHFSTFWLLPVFVWLIALGLLWPRLTASTVVPPAVAAATAGPALQMVPTQGTADGATPTQVVASTSGAPFSLASAAVLSPAGSRARQTAPGNGSRTVLGYYVPYDPTSWASFQTNADNLDYLSAQWVTVDSCGNVGSRDDRTLLAFAEEHGVKVLPSLLTSSGWLNNVLLTDPDVSEHYLSEIVRYVDEMGYPGFDLDMEGINAEDRDAYSEFVGKLAGALHQRGKILTLAIPAKTTDVRTGWAGPYDYAALGQHADLILLMTYDYSWSSGPPGSIAPQGWVDKVAAYAVTQIPAEKVLIGLAFYGYDWNTTQGGRARALLHSQAVALAQMHGTEIVTDEASRSGTFSYTANPGDTVPPPPSLPALRHDIAVRPLGQCGVPPSGPTPTPIPTPSPTPVPAAPQKHEVWAEGTDSVAGRVEIVLRYGIGGLGAWRMGQEDADVWPILAGYRKGSQ